MTAKHAGAINALVVLGSTLTALAVVRSARHLRQPVYVLDDRRGPASRTRFAKFMLLDSESLTEVQSALSGIAATGRLAIIADSDRWLRFLLVHGDTLRAKRIAVLHPSNAALQTCLDKDRFLDWCADTGLPAPRRFALTELKDWDPTDLPLLLRPAQTQHSSGAPVPKATEVRSRDEFERAMARFRDAGVSANVCESLLRPGLRQLSVGIARNSAGATVTFLAEKIRPPAQRCAGGTFVRPAEYPQAEALAARALEALDYLGLAEVEILCDPAERRLWIVEVNARPWLQCSLPLACGCDLLAHVLASRSAKHTSIDARHAWLHFWPDLQLCFSRNGGLVTLGDLTVSEYAKSLWMADVFPVWDWSDPAPLVSAASDFTRRRFKSLLNRKRR